MSISPSLIPLIGAAGQPAAAAIPGQAPAAAPPGDALFQALLALLLQPAAPAAGPVPTLDAAPAAPEPAAAGEPAGDRPEGAGVAAALAALLPPGLVAPLLGAPLPASTPAGAASDAAGGAATQPAPPLPPPAAGPTGAAESGPADTPVAGGTTKAPRGKPAAAPLAELLAGAAEVTEPASPPGAARASQTTSAAVTSPATPASIAAQSPTGADGRRQPGAGQVEAIHAAGADTLPPPAQPGPAGARSPLVAESPSRARPEGEEPVAPGEAPALTPAPPAGAARVAPLSSASLDSAAEPRAAGGPIAPAGVDEIVHHARLISAPGRASLRLALTPEGLGEVQVAIDVSGRGAAVQFAAGTAEAHAAIESQLPSLRIALENSGLTVDTVAMSDATSAGLGGSPAFDLNRQGLPHRQEAPLPPSPLRAAAGDALAAPERSARTSRPRLDRPGRIDVRA